MYAPHAHGLIAYGALFRHTKFVIFSGKKSNAAHNFSTLFRQSKKRGVTAICNAFLLFSCMHLKSHQPPKEVEAHNSGRQT